MKITLTLTALAAALVLVACKGGGGEKKEEHGGHDDHGEPEGHDEGHEGKVVHEVTRLSLERGGGA